MHILHILNSYGGTEVYTQLISSLDELGVKQTIFVPLNPRNKNRSGSNLINFKVKESNIIYSNKLRWYHRYFYVSKINTAKSVIENSLNIKDVSLINAGLFCSDGAIAFELSKQYKIPYIVAVRNTDVNTYYKKMWWKRSYFHKILHHSKRIIFLSYKYKEFFLAKVDNSKKELLDKSIVIPNGINDYFLQNRNKVVKQLSSPIKIIYAGAINKGKNIINTINALKSLTTKGYKIQFSIIGRGLKNRKEDKEYLEEIKLLATHNTWIEIHESMEKESLLTELLKNDIFVMPSTPETFGIVYLEALSQGLPVIYASGQGFDGYFAEGEIGYSVKPTLVDDIAHKVEDIIKNYPRFANSVNELKLEEKFSWEKISLKYFEIYKNIIR